MLRVLVSPRMLGVHLLGLVAVAAAVALGLWQYGAWQSAREAQATDLANVAPKPLQEVLAPDQPYPADAVGRPVELAGRWLPDETFYVSGREHAQRRGYWVVTPVAVEAASGGGRAPAMLVVRGWTAEPGGVSEPTGRTAVTGWLQPSEGSGTPDTDPGDDIFPELRIASVVQRLDRDLYGGYVIRDVSASSTGGDSSTGGLEPVTPASLPEPSTFTSIRNLLYAGEWWVFGAFAAFIWWRWCRDAIHAAREPERELAEVASRS